MGLFNFFKKEKGGHKASPETPTEVPTEGEASVEGKAPATDVPAPDVPEVAEPEETPTEGEALPESGENPEDVPEEFVPAEPEPTALASDEAVSEESPEDSAEESEAEPVTLADQEPAPADSESDESADQEAAAEEPLGEDDLSEEVAQEESDSLEVDSAEAGAPADSPEADVADAVSAKPEEERVSLFRKLFLGLARTRARLAGSLAELFSSHKSLSEDFWEELEEILITADVGVDAATKLVTGLRKRVRRAGVETPEDCRELLCKELEEAFPPLNPKKVSAAPEVVLVIGVNGVGKTTTIAKLAHRACQEGKRPLIAAGDTFRAAAIEQLGIWAERTGSGFYAKGQDADPAAVAYEALDMALREGYDLVLVDTAGRLHTKVDLMNELVKIQKVLAKKHPGAPHRTLLVLDSTTGQNALSQTKVFNQAVGVDEIVLTKLDGTAKGGIAVAVALLFSVPISFVGLGEQMEDLRPFNGPDFARALLGME